jgi:hypothetical protein
MGGDRFFCCYGPPTRHSLVPSCNQKNGLNQG